MTGTPSGVAAFMKRPGRVYQPWPIIQNTPRWPSFKINDAVKHFISRVFQLLDKEDAIVGDSLADKIFVSNGKAELVDTISPGKTVTHLVSNSDSSLDNK